MIKQKLNKKIKAWLGTGYSHLNLDHKAHGYFICQLCPNEIGLISLTIIVCAEMTKIFHLM